MQRFLESRKIESRIKFKKNGGGKSVRKITLKKPQIQPKPKKGVGDEAVDFGDNSASYSYFGSLKVSVHSFYWGDSEAHTLRAEENNSSLFKCIQK